MRVLRLPANREGGGGGTAGAEGAGAGGKSKSAAAQPLPRSRASFVVRCGFVVLGVGVVQLGGRDR